MTNPVRSLCDIAGTNATFARPQRYGSLMCWSLVVLASLSSFQKPAFAIDPSEYLSELHHTQWTSREGAPSGINAITQTSDGYLWLASQTGLYRFDGVHFEIYVSPIDGKPLTGDVSALFAVADRGLWVGMRFGDIYFIQDARLTHYSSQEGLRRFTAFNFAIRRDGTLWVQTAGGLYRLEKDRWVHLAEDSGYTPKGGHSLIAAANGTLWARSNDGTFYLPPDAIKFVKSSRIGGGGWIFPAPNGDLWTSEPGPGMIALSGPERRIGGFDLLSDDDAGIGNAVFDRDGGLWTETLMKNGEWNLVRIPGAGSLLSKGEMWKPGDIQVLKQTQSRIDGPAYAMFEDREGNIWMGNLGSLDRFRPNKFHSALETSPSVHAAALSVDKNGTAWLANATTALSFAPGQTLPTVFTDVNVNESLGSLWADGDGSLWFGRGSDTIVHYLNHISTPLENPPESKRLGVQSIVRDKGGALWISEIGDGLFRRDEDHWTAKGSVKDLPTITPFILSPDDEGRLWVGYTDGTLALVEKNHAVVLSAKEGLRVGHVLAIRPTVNRVWIGGTNGVQLLSDGHFLALRTSSGLELTGVSGIVQESDGTLWLNGGMGIVRIDSAEIAAFLKNRDYRVEPELMNFEDGLHGTAEQLRPIPTAMTGGDGRIWFTTNGGAYWIDPKHIRRNPTAPPVYVQAFVVDGARYGVNAAVLPTHTSNFEVDYTSPSLSIPGRVHFRYRLTGVDKEWQEAGTRRQAYYTNVSPGEHLFQVTAANEDGVWNATGASVSFKIAAAYYQTRWFFTICVLLVLLVLWQVYRMRVHQLSRQFQARTAARLEERDRIARELHDTLLQSTQGLILLFQGFAGRVRDPEPMREEMEVALDQADVLLNEARERVSDLRTTGLENNVEQAITRAGQELFADSATKVGVVAAGTPRPLVLSVADDIFRIAREALTNAYAHANAKIVEIEIAYETEEFRLNIRDDGRGINEEVLKTGSKPNHFGLQGMRERTQRSGGTLNVWSKDGAGTEIALKIPAKKAYAKLKRRTRWMPTDLFSRAPKRKL
jgi:signal transduction histidine kinase/ligand-binding sensor domain-containing protein